MESPTGVRVVLLHRINSEINWADGSHHQHVTSKLTLTPTSGKSKSEWGLGGWHVKTLWALPDRCFWGKVDSSWKGKKLSLGIDSRSFIIILGGTNQLLKWGYAVTEGDQRALLRGTPSSISAMPLSGTQHWGQHSLQKLAVSAATVAAKWGTCAVLFHSRQDGSLARGPLTGRANAHDLLQRR